jgi:hypothetical protein
MQYRLCRVLCPFYLSMVAVCAYAVPAKAALITASALNPSSQFVVNGTDRGAVHSVDGSGLDSSNPPLHTNQPNGEMWLNTGDGSFGGGADPHPNGDLAQITFGFTSGINSFGSFRVWNYNELNGFNKRSVQTLTISTAANSSGPFTPLTDPNNNNTTWTFDEAPGTSGYAGQLFTFTAPVTAAYVRFDILTNYDQAGTDHGFVGLSEIQFYTPVPEPASLISLGVGGGSLLLARRRPRRMTGRCV